MALFGRPTTEDELRAGAYREWLRRRNPLAIASLVFGIFSLIEFGALLVFGVAGIVLGALALAQLKRVDGTTSDAAPDPAVTAETVPLAYGDTDLAPPVDASKYEPIVDTTPKTYGHRLAWTGIMLSVLSLVIAAVIYTHPWSR